MGRVVISMSVSLDGFVNDAAGTLEWVTIDEEIHRAFNDESRACGAFVYGRRMYELMTGYWPTAEEDPDASPAMRDFARIWKPMPKYVASTSLREVGFGARLIEGDAVEAVARLRDEVDGDIGIGGPTLAAPLLRAGLVDEVSQYVNPVVLGAGTPFYPRDLRLDLRLAEVRRFEAGVVKLRYVRG